MLSREEREELKALSTEIFGSSSKYQRLTQGFQEIVTKEVEEDVPGENGAEATKRMVKVPLLDNQGRKQVRIREYSFEEARNFLLDLKAKHTAMIEKQIAMQKQEANAKMIQDELSGSSV